ncbi:MAG: TraR/DksA C4-type zinc finger protein [Burkholderiales bacterium]|nr:TraR/DksA C4-type zinc finger protein [Burkholderiales bacterium]
MSKHLSAEQRAELEMLMLTRQRELTRQINAHHDGGHRSEHAREVLLQDGDDAPQRDADREVDFALSDMETAELAALKAAQARMAEGLDGHYGRCTDCGADIPFARLKLEPQALRCVKCETARERGGPRHASL